MGDDDPPDFVRQGTRASKNRAAEDAEVVEAFDPSAAGVAITEDEAGATAPVRRARPAKPPVKLTAREVECLDWASKGKSEWEISQILGISEHTAEKHLINARLKLGAVNRVQAVALALRQGLIR